MSKLKHPKPPSGTNSISVPTFFCVKGKDCPKYYYFIANLGDIDTWMTLLSFASCGPEKLEAKLKEKSELPTLLLHTTNCLSPRVDFSNEVDFREIDYENESQFCNTTNFITPPNSMRVDSPPISSYCDSPRSINSDHIGSFKSLHSGSVSSGSTLSYRSSCGSDNCSIDTPRSMAFVEFQEAGAEQIVERPEGRSWSRCDRASNYDLIKSEISTQHSPNKSNEMMIEDKSMPENGV